MSSSDLKELVSEELKQKLDSLNGPELFNDILDLARFHARNSQFTDSNICCRWLIANRKAFAPAYIQLCSNYLSLKDFASIDAILSDSMDIIQGNENQLTLLKYMYAKSLLELNLLDKTKLVLGETKEWEAKPLWYNLVEIDVLFKSGEIDKVLSLLDEKIDYYADNKVFVKKKFEILNKTGQSDEAYRQILASLEKDENNLELLHQKAMINYDNKEFLEAKLTYNKIIKLSNDYKAHLWLGRIHKIEGDNELADYHLGQAFKLATNNADRLHCLNILAELSEDNLIDQLVELWFSSEGRIADNLLELARVRSKQLKHNLAEELLNEAIELSEDPRLYFELSKVYSSKKDYDKAEAVLLSHGLMETPPINYFAWLEYCLIAKRRGRWDIALQRFRELSKLYPENFDIKTEIVNVLIRLSEFTEAYSYLKGEIESNPANLKAWRSLIDCYYQNQNYFEALRLMDDYVNKFGTDEKLFYYKSACLREVGRYEESESAIKEGLNVYPDSFDLKMSYAHLNRRLSSEYFFEKDDYNRKALDIHRSAKPLYAYQQRVLNSEIVNDLVHLNNYSEALDMINQILNETPDHAELYQQKVRVLSKMGNHNEAYALINELPDLLRSDIQMKTLEANELLALDKWEECNQLLREILEEEKLPDALIVQIKLLLRQGNLNEAKLSFKTLFDLSPHHAFIYNDLIDFALTNQDLYLDFYEKLDIHHDLDGQDLVKVFPSNTQESSDWCLMSFDKNVPLSHIALKNDESLVKQLYISSNGNDFLSIDAYNHKQTISDDKIIVQGVFDINSIKLPSIVKDEIDFYTIFPVHTDDSIQYESVVDSSGALFSMNIVETGLGDQLHYMRTSALLAESLGMKFEGILRSQLEIIRDRVTENPSLYNDLGMTDFLIEDDNYEIIPVHLNLKTRFIPALYQWNSFYQFLDYINGLITEAIENVRIQGDKLPLIYLSVDDHNFTRLIARLFYPYHEPETKFIQLLRKPFIQKRDQRLTGSQSAKTQVLLQCRLGDVANIPINYKGENVWVIPFSGEVMKDNVSNKYHMRYSNLDKIRDIGLAIKNEFGDSVDLKLITDGYDYGIDYLKEYQKNLMLEMGIEHNDLESLKSRLHEDFDKAFDFVDEIVYGEEYEKLIRSIDLVTSSKVLISTNGQFTNEFKMSFASSEEDFLIVKKLYSNLRVSRSINSKELFWETDGYDSDALIAGVIDFIKRAKSTVK